MHKKAVALKTLSSHKLVAAAYLCCLQTPAGTATTTLRLVALLGARLPTGSRSALGEGLSLLREGVGEATFAGNAQARGTGHICAKSGAEHCLDGFGVRTAATDGLAWHVGTQAMDATGESPRPPPGFGLPRQKLILETGVLTIGLMDGLLVRFACGVESLP